MNLAEPTLNTFATSPRSGPTACSTADTPQGAPCESGRVRTADEMDAQVVATARLVAHLAFGPGHTTRRRDLAASAAVAQRLLDQGASDTVVAAGWLHRAVRVGLVSIDEVAGVFGVPMAVALDAANRRPGECSQAHADRVRSNRWATALLEAIASCGCRRVPAGSGPTSGALLGTQRRSLAGVVRSLIAA